VDGIFVSFLCHVNTEREIGSEISRKCKVNGCQFSIPLGIVYSLSRREESCKHKLSA
jgi:hypothetical protein